MEKMNKIKLVANDMKNKGFGSARNYFYHWHDLKGRPGAKRAEIISAQIEPTAKCNLRCPMCQHSFDKLLKPDLDINGFLKIIDQMPYLSNLTLQGLGEPLLNPHIFLMIKAAKDRHIRVGLTTNATLLHEDHAKKIIDSGLDWMYVSLDSAEKESYEKIRVGADFESVMKNLRNFFQMKGASNPDTNFWTLIMKENSSQIEGLIRLAESLGIKRIVMQNIHNWGHADFSKNIRTLKDGVGDAASEMVARIKALQSNVSVEIFSHSNNRENGKCDWPWRATYITCDGFVVPCCMQGCDPQIINFGNIFQDEFKNILNNDKFQNFRNELMKEKNQPSVCLDCPYRHNQNKITI
jgi:radical SAM protein with 4Fe4S-binding SPASM domain